MVGVAPFAESERREIKTIAQVIFDGGDPTDLPETAAAFPKYRVLFEIFPRLIDARHGNFLHLPFEGSVMDQPDKTMKCLDIIRSEFRKKIDSEQKKAMSGARKR